MYGSVVAEQEISTDERTSTFLALKRALLCVRSLVSTSVFAATEGAIAVLAFVLLFWSSRSLSRGGRRGRGFGGGCHGPSLSAIQLAGTVALVQSTEEVLLPRASLLLKD